MSNVRLKKINAILSLLTILAILVHIGFSVYAYLTLTYHPTIKGLTSRPFMALACIHAIFGVVMVIPKISGIRLYPRENVRTIFQRLSALSVIPLLILHLNLYNLLRSSALSGKWVSFSLLLFCQALFYGMVLLHIAVSLTRALITMGWLASREKQKSIDRIVCGVCAVVFMVAVCAIMKGQLDMFLPK